MAKKKIKLILPILTPDEQWLKDTNDIFSAYQDQDTVIDIACLSWGPQVIEQHYDDIWSELATVLEIEKAEQEGYDGAVVFCANDPGVRAAREKVIIPVVGLMETAVHLAYILGRRFSILTTKEGGKTAAEDLLRLYDCTARCASIRIIDVAVTELQDQGLMFLAAIREAEQAVLKDGADTIILGCGMMIGLKEKLENLFGVRVIEPGPAALKLCEDLIDLKLAHSKRAYPTPLDFPRVLPSTRME